MSFAACTPRSFTMISVQKNAPEASGIYGLSNNREWIFIGETSNIQAQLITHLTEANTRLSDRIPTGFAFEVCSPLESSGRLRILAHHLKPIYSRPN